MEIDLTTDNPEPSDIDWPHADDAAVWHAARAGVAQAVAEAARRNAR